MKKIPVKLPKTSISLLPPVDDGGPVEVKPFGIHVGGDGMRPILLFKDDTGEVTVPVRLSSVDAAVTLAQSNPVTANGSPHRLAEQLLASLNVRIRRAVLFEIKNTQQYLRLEFENHPALDALSLRADEGMSFCLHMNVPIFATRHFIRESKTYLQDLHQLQAQTKVGRPDPRLLLQKNHGYLM